MKRSQLAHILRAAYVITRDPNMLVIGSQSILGSFTEEELPTDATRSIEADVAFLDDPDEKKSDLVDGGIGEESRFHQTFGTYGQGVSISTATLPAGWEDRLIPFDDPEAGDSRARCLEPHDLVVSKLVAGREKDFEFARALLDARLVRAETLLERAELLPPPVSRKRRVIRWIEARIIPERS
ncbi:MAG: hypothetical protein HY658_07700 [Actinobacteria bacterium]|nr:hypothetical protein [Actinomycetota bacterium]